MSVSSKEFEQQIKRIHELIEQPGSVITWDDRIPDPDNPKQLRQIDISIRRDGKLTLIECRIHNKPQDVKWIEELIGRRLSLQADTMIAVSALGFTDTARKKAARYGIFLRDLLKLTDEEVRQRGNKAKVWIKYVKFNELSLVCVLRHLPEKKNVLPDIATELRSNNDLLHLIFDRVATAIDSRRISASKSFVQCSLELQGFSIAEGLAERIQFSSEIELIREQIQTPYIAAYAAPAVPVIEREVKIEEINFGKTQIIQSSNKASIVLDFSGIKSPPNAYFLDFTIDMNRQINAHIEAVGLEAFLGLLKEQLLENMNLSIGFQVQNGL